MAAFGRDDLNFTMRNKNADN